MAPPLRLLAVTTDINKRVTEWGRREGGQGSKVMGIWAESETGERWRGGERDGYVEGEENRRPRGEGGLGREKVKWRELGQNGERGSCGEREREGGKKRE